MCFEFVRVATSCIRVMCGLMFCFICGGPVCLIVGLILIIGGNNRENAVEDFNHLVNAYNPKPATTLWLPATIGGEPAVLESRAVQVTGFTTGLSAAVSELIVMTGSYMGGVVPYNLSNSVDFAQQMAPDSKWFYARAFCNNGYGCTLTQMDAWCTVQYGTSSTFVPTSDGGENNGGTATTNCPGRGNCGYCKYISFLTEHCIVMDVSTGPPYRPSIIYRSCFYPFTDETQRYTSNIRPSFVQYQVRQSDDPFVALQLLTKGSGHFETPRDTQKSTGIALLVIGVLFTLCSVLVAVGLVKALHHKRSEDKERDLDDPNVMTEVGAA